jgi:hypothetical protein
MDSVVILEIVLVAWDLLVGLEGLRAVGGLAG